MTLSCKEGSMMLRPEWPWRAWRYKIVPDESIQYWNLFLFPPPPAMLFFHLSSDQWWQCRKCFWRLSLILQNSIAPSSSLCILAWRRRWIYFSDTSKSAQQQFRFCFVVSNDELLYPCASLRANNGSPRSIMSFFFFQNNVLGLLMKETWLKLVCPCRRAKNGSHRSIIHQVISFPLSRRPSFVIVPFVPWVCAFNKLVFVALRVTGDTSNNGSPRSIIHFSFRTQGTMTFITSLPRAFWCRGWHNWGCPCN